MEHIYEYLIGGRKTGIRQTPKWEDLGVGDIVYYWAYADSSFNKAPETDVNAIMILNIKNIKITNGIVTITTVALNGGDDDNTFNFAGGHSSTGKMVDNDGLKLYCATTFNELEKIVPVKFFKTAKISDLTKK